MLLYYITDRSQFPGGENERRKALLVKIAKSACAGVDYIQLREKDLGGRDLERWAREGIHRVRASGASTKLLINSRTDIALAIEADGVHLRSNDISPAEVRKIWRQANASRDPIIAVSCHFEAEVIAAERSGADFVVFGPVFEKQGSPDSQIAGLEPLRSACRHKIPVLALGGLTPENAKSAVAAGARGVAGIRLFQEGDVKATIEKLRS